MPNQMFNPDDFVFEKFPTPEQRKPILEYDAINRLILTRFKNDQGEFDYYSTYLSSTVNKNLLEHIPDEWSNENDQIILFAIYEDGEYLLEKQKMKYDFNTKRTAWIRYEYKHLTLDDAKELFNILKAAILTQNTNDKNEKNAAILSVVNKQYYLNQVYNEKTEIRDKLLRETDWTQLPDAPETFEGELELWRKWRDKLRTIVKSPSDFEDSLDFLIYNEDFKWPIDPIVYNDGFRDKGVEYLETEDQYSKTVIDTYSEVKKIIDGSVEQAVLAAKEEIDTGISVEKQIYDIIEKYNLSDGLDHFSLDMLRVGE